MFLHKKNKDQIIIAQTLQQTDKVIPIHPVFAGYNYFFGM